MLRFAYSMTLTALALAAVALNQGCSGNQTRFEITNYLGVGQTEYYHEFFDDCFYATGEAGNVDLVLRRCVAPGQDCNVEGHLTQIVHVRTVFRAVPGRTHADSTMINGLVSYAIITDHGAVCFEGGGFLFCEENQHEKTLHGQLELSKLHPTRRVGQIGDIFDRAELKGTFTARPDRKKVVEILNEMDRLFGLRPPYQRPDHPDPI